MKMAYIKHFWRPVSLFLLANILFNGISLGATNIEQNTEQYREAYKKSAYITENNETPKFSESYFAKLLDNSGIKLLRGTTYTKSSKETQNASIKCKSLVYQTLSELPYSHRGQLSELTLYYSTTGRRGLGGEGAIILRCLNVTDSELASVFTHEMGHIADGSVLTGRDNSGSSGFYDFSTPVAIDDPSLNFYKISWDSDTARKPNTYEYDFVSLYAMTDPFEDFAETYTYYRLHGAEFRQLTKSSNALKLKYEFMKKYVFGGEEFGDYTFGATAANQTIFNIWKRNYDVTVLPFDVRLFLKS